MLKFILSAVVFSGVSFASDAEACTSNVRFVPQRVVAVSPVVRANRRPVRSTVNRVRFRTGRFFSNRVAYRFR